MKPLIQIEHLTKSFKTHGQLLKAIDNLSLSIYPREILGLVGESGSGKTTLARLLVLLDRPTHGKILLKGEKLEQGDRKKISASHYGIQYLFQDPYSSLNPHMTAKELIEEPLIICRAFSRDKRDQLIQNSLKLVGLSPSQIHRFPHTFSGGQQQKISIARALILTPQFLICDEPFASLDTPIQAQIANLLKSLQKKLELTYLFISHDLPMAKYLSDRIAVMYLGQLVEIAPTQSLYEKPLHPYTQSLLFAAQSLNSPWKKHKIGDFGEEIPDKTPASRGCIFQHQCPKVMPTCRRERPSLQTVEPQHRVACHLYDSALPQQYQTAKE